jgi:predicted GNAT superfamily acetyltransferase
LGAAALSEFLVRDVTEPDELSLCVKLYEEVFRLGPGDGSLNTRLLVGMVRNSGFVVGAFAGGEMIGFALSFLAFDRARQLMYQYSQLAVVAEKAQGKGVGRRLKEAQRDAARSMGVSTMRWSFDPFLVRNAHFNLNVVGACAFKVERNLYGTHGHGLDAQETTDRLIAQWDLTGASDRPTVGDASQTLVIPTEWSRHPDDEERRRREKILVAFDDIFAKGFVAVGCALEPDERAVYSFQMVATP